MIIDNEILWISPLTTLGECLSRSLVAEGYELTQVSSIDEAQRLQNEVSANLVIANCVRRPPDEIARLEGMAWSAPLLLLRSEESQQMVAAISDDRTRQELRMPFSFQDLLLIVQDMLYQRTLRKRRPFRFSPDLADAITEILRALREDLRANCVVLSSSGGRLIASVGGIDRGTAITLAALMSGSFTASSRAAQLFGDEDMFDSSLQESEGYGLYAIRLQDSLILSVAFSNAVTAGMVRHYAAQGAIDILELMVSKSEDAETLEALELSAEFRENVNDVLGDILGE
jgi:predicted regulator of Ras-like GTPase activity (Roadblock/LC7/MglB family)